MKKNRTNQQYKKLEERAQIVSITVPPKLLHQARKKAYTENPTFSAYIVKLIKEDFASPSAELEKAFNNMCKSLNSNVFTVSIGDIELVRSALASKGR